MHGTLQKVMQGRPLSSLLFAEVLCSWSRDLEPFKYKGGTGGFDPGLAALQKRPSIFLRFRVTSWLLWLQIPRGCSRMKQHKH